MDWDNARIFLSIFRAGTLRGAAAELQVDQATVGRRLSAMERSLGARLFLRTPTGYVPTPAGDLAMAAAQEMERAAHRLQREMQGIDHRLSGVVRVATSDTMALYFVTAALHRLHLRHPDIKIMLNASTQLSSLTRRETDLAVRNVRPTDPELITRQLTRRHMGLYAAKTYVAEHGEPKPGTALAGHDVVIYQSSVSPRQSEKLCGESTANARVAMEVNTGVLLLEAACCGMGIAELPTHMADKDPRLQRIWPERTDNYTIWLVLHSDLARTARVRATVEAIAESFDGE